MTHIIVNLNNTPYNKTFIGMQVKYVGNKHNGEDFLIVKTFGGTILYLNEHNVREITKLDKVLL